MSISNFTYRKTISLGNYDKNHQYETEELIATSDESFDEAMKEVRAKVSERIQEIISMRNAVSNCTKVSTKP